MKSADSVTPSRRQALLAGRNIHSLRQALALVERIDDRAYRETPPGFAPHRAGAHLRHILEFFECFLDGIESGRIDYDARRRDLSVETSRPAAIAKIRTILASLENRLPAEDRTIRVRVEDSYGSPLDDPYLTSSAGRELQVLCSHTIHHFALIAMTLTAHGIPVDREFGMAPSTLRYLNQRTSGAEAA